MSAFILGLYVPHIGFIIGAAERVCIHGIALLQKYILQGFFFFPFPPLLFSLSLSPYLDKSVSSDTPSQKSKNEVVKGTVLPKIKNSVILYLPPCVISHLF